MKQDLDTLLQQYVKHNGRGNMIASNETMLEIVITLAAMIKQPCQCKCVSQLPQSSSVDSVVPPDCEPVDSDMITQHLGVTESPRPIDIEPMLPTGFAQPEAPLDVEPMLPEGFRVDDAPVKRGVGRPRKV